jgi:hypothetical protein
MYKDSFYKIVYYFNNFLVKFSAGDVILLILVKILKKSYYSAHSSSKGAVNAYFLTGPFSKKTWLFEAVVLVG